MINWFNMPAEGLSNGGQFEIKELTATENGEYEKDGEVYKKVTVNVSGGGSSDFSTAEVTLIGKDGSLAGNVYLPIVQDAVVEEEIPDMAYFIAKYIANETHTYNAIMYKGAVCGLIDNAVGRPIDSITGNAQDMGNGYLLITGDCTITIS